MSATALLWSKCWPVLFFLGLFMAAIFLVRFVVRRYRLM